jgi:hypothetical protein
MNKKAIFKWEQEEQDSFDQLKEIMVNAVVLKHPDFDKTFIVSTDASGGGLGAILSQENEDGIEQPIMFASKSLNKAQHNYSATELELLAMVWAVTDKFRQFTLGREIIVTSDHEALKYMNRKESPTDSKRIQRWMIKLLGYDIEIRYRKGKENDNVDALSRLYEDQQEDNGLQRPEL